jgi:amino acid adenylation domain-containing protein
MITQANPSREHIAGTAAEPSTVVELLQRRALRQPDTLAFTFLADGEEEEAGLTYGQLDRQARSIAAWLQQLRLAGERVLLLYPPGLDYIEAFFGCLYARAVAVPAYPPRQNQSLTRLQSVVADSEATLVLTTQAVMSRAESLFSRVSPLESLRWLATDSFGDELAREWREPKLSAETLAFLQYTSGSTAEPKGVMVTHANLLHNERMIQSAFRQTEQSVIVGWLPLYHDMGLIGNVLQPLHLGAPAYLMSPAAFLQRPFRWLQAITRYRATTSGGPNFAYELCARKVTPEQRELLDLSSWSVAFNGSEPVRAETLERFAEAFGPCGFRRESFHPCYGMAEATLLISGVRASRAPLVETFHKRALEAGRAEPAPSSAPDAKPLVSCGAAPEGQRVLVVHPERLTECAPGEVGEIWVAGLSVTEGYWRHPELTELTFHARTAGGAGEPFLRTGDLGFLHRGELFVTGRLKDLIIIRGVNHYPQDIELTAERAHASLRPGGGSAFSVEAGGEERLVVVQEVERRREADAPEIFEQVRRRVAEAHEVEPYALVLVRAGSIPKTSSGKIRRAECRSMFLNGGLDAVAEWRARTDTGGDAGCAPPPAEMTTETVEAWLVEHLAARLGVGTHEVDVNEPITRYGLDSLAAIELMHDIEVGLGVILPMATLLQSPTVSQLAAQAMLQLAGGTAAFRPSRPPAGRPAGEAALSYGQRALYFLQQLAPESPAYNIFSAMRLRPELDVESLRRCFQALVDRHPSLRTTFEDAQDEPVRLVHERVEVDFEAEDASGLSRAELQERLAAEAYRPFDLARGPLFRARLFALSPTEHVLLLAVHHIVADLWSLAVLLHELSVLYSAERACISATLPALNLDHADYANWQAGLLAGPEGERLRGYWQEKLSGELPVLELPADRQRPPVQTYRGASHPFELSPELTRALRALGREHSATLFMTLLAAFQVLLHRYTGQRDILVGSPTAGRAWAELTGVVGYFVNPVVLRADFARPQTFEQFLRDVRETVLGAFEHQEYPFALLVERLQPVRDPSRSPLVQVMFALQKAQTPEGEGLAAFALGETGAGMRLGELEIESVGLEQRVAQFDLTLLAAEVGGGLSASLQYNTDLFDAETVARMAGHYLMLLEGIVADPRRPIEELPLLTEGERTRMLVEWNETRAPYAHDLLAHELFERHAERAPEAVAVSHAGREMTYAELDARANRLARLLRCEGVGPESRVGVLMNRSTEMVVALLAALKAGGAYVPLDPAYPRERLAFMLEDSRAGVLLTEPGLLGALPQQGARVICLDEELWTRLAGEGVENVTGGARAANLAYVIYTSGSTGTPRGVQIEHGSLLNLIAWHRRAYAVSPETRSTQLAGVGFDASVWELWPYLTAGASVHMPDEETRVAPAALRDWLVERRITHSFVPTPLAEQMLSLDWPRGAALGVILTGGDRLSFYPPPALPFELVNHYGPTEYTVVTSCVRVPPRVGAETPPPIGRPIDNTEVYLLDAGLRPVPAGIAGELYVGGAGLARGYLDRPALTAERFIPHPFSQEPGARLYRTGDLARFLADGQLEFLGRVDHQVKIRGFRVELGEVEAVLCMHEGVREAVAVALEDGAGGKRVAAYFTATQGAAPQARDLRSFMKERLPDYMVPSSFVPMEELPLTPNGKVDRRALPAPAEVGAEPDESRPAGPSPTEEVLAGIWSQVLGVSGVGVGQNFFESGGHSLMATQLLSRVREVFKVELPLRTLFEEPTLAGLAAAIDRAVLDEAGLSLPPLTPVARDGALPLSFAQQRLWFLGQLEPESPFYNVPAAVRVRGRLDAEALRRSLEEVVRRHEPLRTRFVSEEGQPAQVVMAPAEFRLPMRSLRTLPIEERQAETMRLAAEEAQRPFDLSAELPLRAELLQLDEEEHVLLVTAHHIVSDGWSMRVLVEELAEVYGALAAGGDVPQHDLAIQYADYAAWQRACLQGEVLEAHLAYWKEQLAGCEFVLDLPAARPRPPVQTFSGATAALELPMGLGPALKELSRREGVTLFMTLLAAFDVLLHRYTGQDDFVVGTPIAGRSRPELEELVGLFVNTLALRADLSGDPTFRELLTRIREAALGAYAHQDLPFEKLVEELQPRRDPSRTPLFQVMLALQTDPTEELRLGELEVGLLKVETGTSKFDLVLSLTEGTDGRLEGSLEYNTDLFDTAAAEGMTRHLRTLLEAVAQNPDRRVSELPLMGEDERRQVLFGWNHTGAEYEPECLHRLFEEQAARTPDAVAVVFGDERLSYAELNERADRLAHRLRGEGVGPESRVGVLLNRSSWLVVSLLAVLKAGGAYVPLDPAYPYERLRFMLEDSGAGVLLTEEGLRRHLPEHSAKVVCVDAGWDALAREATGGTAATVTPRNLAYVIYTSGSTGRPKGVGIEHGSAAALLRWAHEVFDAESLAGVLASTSVCFDLSVFELFVPLGRGGKVILADNALHLPELGAAGEVTLVNTVPSAIAELLRVGGIPASTRTVNLAGEPLQARLVRQLYELDTVEQVFNLYGPTEDTTYSTFVLTRSDRPVTIGRPVALTRLYLLDRYMQPTPAGAPGEVYIGGAGLARGYLGRPALTAERFVPDPFSGEAGARLYRTGDLARRLPDGELDYLGRVDHQVKLRGFRIELGEIEAALRARAGVEDAVAVVREEASGEKRLVAYVVAAQGGPAPDAGELRDHLRERLPEYMVPQSFVALDALPLTPNGKLDRRALPAPQQSERGAGYVAPRTPVEEKLAAAWRELLGIERVGVNDNFFDLGGHSLLLTQLASRIRSGFGVELPLRSLFEATTVAELSALVERAGGESPRAPSIVARSRDAYRRKVSAGGTLVIPENPPGRRP